MTKGMKSQNNDITKPSAPMITSMISPVIMKRLRSKKPIILEKISVISAPIELLILLATTFLVSMGLKSVLVSIGIEKK